MHTIVSASPKDADLLAGLEMRSESHWGYNSDFMEKFKRIYLITEEFIADHPTYMLKENETIIGFYGIMQSDSEVSLEYLFIEPAFIGKGYGRILWNHALEEYRKLGISEFSIITSPEARGFYFRLGATVFTEVDSLISDGKKTPKLIYQL